MKASLTKQNLLVNKLFLRLEKAKQIYLRLAADAEIAL